MLKYECVRDPDGILIGFDDTNNFNLYNVQKGIMAHLGKPHKGSKSLLVYKNRTKDSGKKDRYKISKALIHHLVHLAKPYQTLILRDDFDEWRIPLTWFEGAELETSGQGVKEYYLVPLTAITTFSIMDPRTRRTGRIWFDEY